MTVPTAGELVSGFWAGEYPSGPMDAYALGSYLLGRNAAGYGTVAPLRAWTVRADQRQAVGPDGRPTVGYPAPSYTPAWVAYDLTGGSVLAAGIDFTMADGYVWFETDPVYAATVRGHVWTDTGPVGTAILFTSTKIPTVPPPANDPGTYAALVAAVVAGCQSPATGSGAETVEAVHVGPDTRYRVVTDAAAYRLPAGDTPAVGVGITLPPYSPVGTAWRLDRLGLPYPPLAGVTVPPGFLPASGSGGPITFYNHTVPIVVDTVSTRTRVRWPLGGSSADVDALWAASHAWGTGAGGRTLAQALDTRVSPTTEPTAADLPRTVNPFQFACRELFAGTAYLLVVDATKFGPGAATVAATTAAVTLAGWPHAAVIVWDGGAQPTPAEVTPT